MTAFFVVCDDETDQEYSQHQEYEAAEKAAYSAYRATGRDFFVDRRQGKMPKQFTSRKADNEAQELAFETVRLSSLARSARKPDQFHFVLAFARDLARDYLAANRPIPEAVGIAATNARSALGLKR